MPKVSVIVPIYNVEQYIRECITSLTCQTLQDIEIICVDDCGTDKSMEIVEQFAKNDKRIKIVHNDKNSGLSESRNQGMKYASAPYIMFCDSDDFFAPNMCEVMYLQMEQTNAELGIFGFEVVYEANFDKKANDDRYFAVKYIGTHHATHEITDKQPVCACGKIYRRDIIEKHDLKFPRGLRHEDEFWFPAYCTWVKNIVFVQDKFYKYRRRAGSIMNRTYSKKCLNLDPLYIAIEYYKYIKNHKLLENHNDWFWSNMFFRLLGVSLTYSGTKYYNNCYAVARNFIDDNWNEYGTDFATKRRIAQIKNRTVHARKYLFGLIKLKETINKKQIEIVGLPVWTKTYRKN